MVRANEGKSAAGFRALKTPDLLAGVVMATASLLGLAAFLYPFFIPMGRAAAAGGMAHASDAPLLTVVLVVLCLAAALGGLGGRQMTSKMVAMLGVLTAMNAVLRALPGIGGFNAVFVLPILAGYCYGATFGFLLGSLSLLVSALIGGGVGPWLPYQMLATGWVGLLSGWLPERFLQGGRADERRRWEPPLLAAWGGTLGLIFGALMNLWFWPFLTGGPPVDAPGGLATQWAPGTAVWTGVRNYLAFYVATSLWWDAGRAVGNVLLLLLLTRPVLRVLRRFRTRFQFDVVPEIIITKTD